MRRFVGLFLILAIGCGDVVANSLGEPTDDSDSMNPASARIRIIIDSDTNTTLDDQHALAYLLFSGDVFTANGMTVNATYLGGGIDEHLQEAQRVVDLCDRTAQLPIYKGAEGDFETIRGNVDTQDFDGMAAVNYMIARAHEPAEEPLLILSVGKLTNVALALEKDPSIAEKIRIVWLGTNYPATGEYNLENDEGAVNFVLDFDVPLEIVVVRYGEQTGTDAVRLTVAEIGAAMPGLGPTVATPVVGRNGGEFNAFGDYSVALFENTTPTGDPPSMALYDMAAVAVAKNPSLSQAVEMPAPAYSGGAWQERPDNTRMVTIRTNFDRDAIVADFFATMQNYSLIQ